MTSTPPPGPMPGQPVPPQGMPPGPVEWQLVEHVPGDPWSVELIVWSGNAIDGVPVPVDDALLGALAEVRRRRADVDATFAGDPLPEGPMTEAGPVGEDAEDEDAERSRFGRWWDGLGRTTGSAQADRWLANVPVKWQLAGAALLLLVFILVMVIGRLMS
ncbi:hypothetical protein [Enemella evansiae]|uniref:hypothetical protein n=1 Tax=Enemella evansiae TaxID=2016499 RepID=UPI000B963610|nr:hypothetical protein [Enemella evansiae]OYO13806.1 hypothetical protein CGZ98_05105 [Enemella evansiae]TDO89853.1 hypothetical protein C8D81_2737 [Enemella evansiae]